MVYNTPRQACPEISPKLPLLPGYRSNTQPIGSASRKATLSYKLGAGPVVESARGAPKGLPAIDLDVLQQKQAAALNSARSTMTHEDRRSARNTARNNFRPAREPDWLKNDKKVLRFFAYRREAVHEDSRELARVRKCTIQFFLEDGSMMICEPREANSGLPQGTFVKRHKVPLPEGGGNYTPQHLACRATVNVYSRSFRIYDCDEFTRLYYEQHGEEQPPAEDLPDDVLALEAARGPRAPDEERKQENLEVQRYYESLFGGGRKNIGLFKYLENDRRVLRFHCVWDDPTTFGIRNFFTMHFYLADDTVEVNEVLKKNLGRGPWPVFFKRGPLYKNPHVNPAPGMAVPLQVPYQTEELVVGNTVMVYGRELLIYDCDEFTREFYLEEHGIEQGAYDVSAPEEPKPEPTYPPHMGLGSEEDTLNGCKMLVPGPPKKDINKLMTLSHLELRFEARMVTHIRDYVDRLFRIKFFIADDTVAIDEITGNNSGFYNGKFCARAKVKNPATGTWFKKEQFSVGSVVEINSVTFRLTRADERTLTYMETDTDGAFPFANLKAIVRKIAGLADKLREGGAALSLAKDELSEHELLTLARACGTVEESGAPASIDVEKLLSLIADFGSR